MFALFYKLRKKAKKSRKKLALLEEPIHQKDVAVLDDWFSTLSLLFKL